MLGYRYHLLNRLGSGGMGAVYRAEDRLSGELVALKRLPTSPLPAADSPELRLALAQEFQALAALRHPNVIGVREYGFDERRQPYFTMELLPEARPITDAASFLSDEAKVGLIWQLLSGLVYIHRHRLIHRDLKPANVLLTGDTVKVLDFGLVTIIGQRPPTSGTLAYMAPELLRGGAAAVASDLYAVGVIAYELLAGWHPFAESLGKWRSADDVLVPDFSYLVLSFPLEEFLRTLMAHEPAARYRDAAAAISALQAATGLDLPLETAATRESFLQAAPFVGREAEMAQLKAALREAINGRGLAWAVRGESGIGKTRLLHALRTQALVEGALVAHAQAAQGGGSPYYLWRDILRPLILATELDDLEAAVLSAVVPDVAHLLGRPIPDLPPLPSAEAARARLVGVVADIVGRCAKQQPLLLLFEDVHWVDRDSLALFQQIRRLAEARPVLLILSYRPGERPSLERSLRGMRQLDLRRLATADVASLSEAMLGRAGRQLHLVDFLQNETEGNTFFIIEVMRTLAEEVGRLDQVAEMALPVHVLAGGMQQMVQRRLQRVAPRYRPLLQLAAVAGRQIDLKVIVHLAKQLSTRLDVRDELDGNGCDVDRWLTAAANGVVLERPDGGLGWQFSHDKLREGLLSQLSAKQKQAAFVRVAEAVEVVHASDLAPHYAKLAYYYGEAGQRRPQRHYLQLAATQAEVTYANEAAAGYYEQLAQTADETAARVEALLQLARVLHFIGRWDEAIASIEEALPLADQIGGPVLQARCHFWLGRVSANRRLFPDALTALESARVHFLAAEDQTGVCETLIEIGICYYFQGQYRTAEPYFLEALELARALDDQRNLASALHNAANVYFDMGDYGLTQRYYEESLALSESLHDKAKMASTLNNLGILASYRGDTETTLRRYEESLAIRREIGDQLGIGVSLNNLGIVHKDRGDFEQATRYYEESLLIHQAHNDPHSMSFPLNNLGAIAFERGDYEQARDLFQQSLALREGSGDRWSVASVVSSLGDVALMTGDLAEAQRLYRRSLEDFAAIGDRLKIAYNLIGLAAVNIFSEAASPAQWKQAAAVLAFVEGLLAADKLALEAAQQRLLDQLQLRLQTYLDPPILAEAQQSGRTMTLEMVGRMLVGGWPADGSSS